MYLPVFMVNSYECTFFLLKCLVHSFSFLFHHFFILRRRVSGFQQLNEWTDILAHFELHPPSSVNNSFEPKPHKTDTDMAKVY